MVLDKFGVDIYKVYFIAEVMDIKDREGVVEIAKDYNKFEETIFKENEFAERIGEITKKYNIMMNVERIAEITRWIPEKRVSQEIFDHFFHGKYSKNGESRDDPNQKRILSGTKEPEEGPLIISH